MKINTNKVFLIIPTIRDLNFLISWKNEFNNCHLMVVEDHPVKQINIPNKDFKKIYHYSWENIEHDLGKESWIISRFNSGVRSYGFWKAYKLGATAVITLDDDCYPEDTDFVDKHLENLNFKIPDRWLNTYINPKWMYTRGMPYKNRNFYKVGISHGLWSGALDLDAKTEIKLPDLLKEPTYGPIRNIIPFGYYYPMCSMNYAFTREITPLMYFPMMGKNKDGVPWPYDRYDDIWAGIFSKKIMDHLKIGVVNGSPMINHKKASKPNINHIKEKNGMILNETVWQVVDNVRLTKTTPKDCYKELARKVKFPKNDYFNQLKSAMEIWAELF
jgi:hypothetical protein